MTEIKQHEDDKPKIVAYTDICIRGRMFRREWTQVDIDGYKQAAEMDDDINDLLDANSLDEVIAYGMERAIEFGFVGKCAPILADKNEDGQVYLTAKGDANVWVNIRATEWFRNHIVDGAA